jgi:hypothetical protein
MLSRWDDFPIHQTPHPVAQPQTGEAMAYDRYWFTMHDRDLATQVGFAFGVYPNRGVVDGALSVARQGSQASVYASAPLTRDRRTAAGPVSLEVVEPLSSFRVVVDDLDGVSADLRFTATTPVVLDNHLRRTVAGRVVADRTRLVQFGAWEGSFTVDGRTTTCRRGDWPGVRDRSWGIRSAGTAAEGGPAPVDSTIYFTWTLLHFPDACLLATVQETPDGRAEARTGALLPWLAPGADPADDSGVPRSDQIRIDVDYLPGTRWPRRLDATLGPRGSIDETLAVVAGQPFAMKGIGYSHPRWRHGTNHGGLVTGREDWLLADLDPSARADVHVQQLCRAVRADGVTGIGLLEHVAIGPHLPSGLGEGLTPRT